MKNTIDSSFNLFSDGICIIDPITIVGDLTVSWFDITYASSSTLMIIEKGGSIEAGSIINAGETKTVIEKSVYDPAIISMGERKEIIIHENNSINNNENNVIIFETNNDNEKDIIAENNNDRSGHIFIDVPSLDYSLLGWIRY